MKIEKDDITTYVDEVVTILWSKDDGKLIIYLDHGEKFVCQEFVHTEAEK
jgi:hypothetical protein